MSLTLCAPRQKLNETQGVDLHICVAAALRRGVTDATEAERLGLAGANLQPGFSLSGLGALGTGGVDLRQSGAILMKRVAFVFTSAPHGSASGREGLDALLATSALTEDIGVFFFRRWRIPASCRPTTAGHSCARLHCDL